MKVAVIGDLMLDLEFGNAAANGDCPERTGLPVYKSSNVVVAAGGAGNAANILRELKATVHLYCDGPGRGDRHWIAELTKQVCRANRICWSNEGFISLKVRGIDRANQVISRLDCDTNTERKHVFAALEALLDEVREGKWDAVLVSDYRKGCLGKQNEEVVTEILKSASCSVVDFKGRDYALYSHATAITPNQPDSMKIFGTDDPCEIRNMVGCKVVYVTRGKDSVLMGCDQGMTEISVEDNIPNVYCVGAGDAFAAGVTMALGQGRSYIEAGVCGVKVAQAYIAKPRKSSLR